MLKLAVILFVVSLIAGALGFTGIAGGARRIALFLFAVFLIIAIVVVVIAIGIGQALL